MKARVLVIVVMLLAPVVGCRTAVLRNPDPISIESSSQDQTRAIIKRSLARRGWVVTNEQPGQIDARLNVRAHVARISITYTADEVRIAYVDSENLKYHRRASGEEVIHKNYLGWINYLEREIAAASYESP
jgi:hypothetical protein